MNIEEVINDSIYALYASPVLAKLLVLKGGGAIRLFDGVDTRLSIDADFSIRQLLDQNAESVFAEMKTCLSKTFGAKGYDLLDFKGARRPSRVRKGFPPWWGGWACEFKLIDRAHRRQSHQLKQKMALIPDGADSPKITIDLSEHEYCGHPRTKTIHGTKVYAYSRDLLVLEKLRAICQQHREYPFRQETKNRARDFYDIYCLTKDMDARFITRCRKNLAPVFEAKEVPIWLLGSLTNDEAFVDQFRRGFDQVKDTVRGQLETFDVYLEHVRFLINDICGKTPERPAEHA